MTDKHKRYHRSTPIRSSQYHCECKPIQDLSIQARAMQQYRKPVQIILPATYDESKRRKRRRSGRRLELQDEATRAWNIHTALYYCQFHNYLQLVQRYSQLKCA